VERPIPFWETDVYLTISKKLKPNEKILMRVFSQGGSSYVALEPK